MEYIPDGLSKAQWAAIKKKEGDKKVGKFDGTSGMSFRSRTFEDFQKGRESGKLTYNMVTFFSWTTDTFPCGL
jgi:5'-3' exonuclease